MFKKVAVVCLLLLLVLTYFGVKAFKPWAMSRIKKEIASACHAKEVKIKDMSIPLAGPIIVTGLEIKRYNELDIQVQQITLEKGLWGIVDGSAGQVEVTSALFNQVRLSDVRIDFWWKRTDLVIHILQGKLLGGVFKGDVILQLFKEPAYQANMVLNALSLPQIIQDFKLKDRFSLTGALSGHIELKGKGKKFSMIKGDLRNGLGGELTINDTQFIKDMVKRMKLNKVAGSEELFVASLQHYPYNNASVVLVLEHNDLMLNADLAGETGRRSFPIVYHDFNLERLGL